MRYKSELKKDILCVTHYCDNSYSNLTIFIFSALRQILKNDFTTREIFHIVTIYSINMFLMF